MTSAETWNVDLQRRCEPVGRCIYCGRTPDEGPLELEHVIPFALNGKLELPEASCRACAKVINEQFEQEYLKNEVIDIRAFLKLRSRSRKRKGDKQPHERQGRVGTVDLNKGPWIWKNIERSDFPFSMTFRNYEMPTFITGKEPTNGIHVTGVNFFFAPDYGPKMSQLGANASYVTFTPDHAIREIAKISHGIAISHFGFGVFDPFLVPLILGQDLLLNRFIGGTQAPLRSKETHTATITLRPDDIIMVRLALFSSIGGSTHLAVVGRLRETERTGLLLPPA